MITALRSKTPAAVRRDVASFSVKYVNDWEQWLVTAAPARPALFVKILGKWQATRPAKLRRLRIRANEHPEPYIDDLLGMAAPHLSALAGYCVGRSRPLNRDERTALAGLWGVFSLLRQVGDASCVAITKAVLLLSDGRIGPAFDSQVRKRLGVGHLRTHADWVGALEQVSDDIQAFEGMRGVLLRNAVPRSFAGLANGRLYDMALGPRSPNKDLQPTAASAMMRRRD